MRACACLVLVGSAVVRAAPPTLQPERLVAAAATPPNERLSTLLTAHSVTTAELSLMVTAAYAAFPAPGGTAAPPSKVGDWVGSKPTGVEKLFLPGVIYSKGDKSIMAFQGVQAAPGNASATPPIAATANGIEACLAANWFKDAYRGYGAFDAFCKEFSTEAEQAVTLTQYTAHLATFFNAHPVTMITGHSFGCLTALTMGRIKGLPVVCFSAAGSFNHVWAEGFSGLKEAIAAKPQPTDLFTIQVKTDPYSNCLVPRLGEEKSPFPPRVYAGAVCSFSGPPPGCAPPVSLAYYPFSPCVVGSHFMPNIVGYVPATFAATECTDVDEKDVAYCPLLKDD